MIKMIKISFLLFVAILFHSCASVYKKIDPKSLNYVSRNAEKNLLLEYKYDLLNKKYKNKENKKDVRIIAVKLTNNTDKDVIFDKDFKLIYKNGNTLNVIETEKIYGKIKQNAPLYLLYLLLTPMQFTTTTATNGQVQTSNAFPAGLIVGPGLALGNYIAATSANKNFKNELKEYDINQKTIKRGETVYGLIGVSSSNYDTIKIKIE